jgi:hypothetical protein
LLCFAFPTTDTGRYMVMLKEKHEEVDKAVRRLRNGLRKLHETEEAVKELKVCTVHA